MPVIKVNSEGLIITKGGLPSCTCCDGGGGPCEPDVATLYVEYTDDPTGAATVSYLTLTGSLNTGSFTGTGPNGDISMDWTAGTFWLLLDDAGGATGSLIRCDPQDFYIDGDNPTPEWYMTISFAPLP